jgi:DNA-directed RNA polymerase specialized sigma24 family protein
MTDPLLQAFTNAPDDAAADAALETLLAEHVVPLVRKVAARKLRSFGGSRFRSEDVEDVIGDATLVMVDRLTELRRAPGAEPIESLLDYTAAVAHHACAHHFRRRHPERARLKNRLRYVFAHRAGLAVWDVAGAGAVCGLAAWQGSEPRPAAMLAHDAVAALGPSALGSTDALAASVESLLRSLGGPIELDALVGLMAGLFAIDAPRVVAVEAAPAPHPAREEAIDRRRAVERVWLEIADLPVRQRLAVLSSLRDSGGASLLWVFPVLGIASIRRIAEVLGWPHDEMAAVWAQLPLDDNQIAARLQCTRQQVINLRQAARKRLANRRDRAGAGAARYDAAS